MNALRKEETYAKDKIYTIENLKKTRMMSMRLENMLSEKMFLSGYMKGFQ